MTDTFKKIAIGEVGIIVAVAQIVQANAFHQESHCWKFDCKLNCGSLANELCLDMHYNYSHNSGFENTYREAYQILGAANSIDATENRNDRAEIARQVQALDPLFHHVQSEIKKWSRQHYQQIGKTGILTQTDAMEALLHHLMNDVGIKPHSGESVEAAPAPATDEIAPPPPSATVTSPPPPTIP